MRGLYKMQRWRAVSQFEMLPCGRERKARFTDLILVSEFSSAVYAARLMKTWGLKTGLNIT